MNPLNPESMTENTAETAKDSPYKLPPMDASSASPISEEARESEGLSKGLKRTIILFTIFTVLCFGAFGTYFVKSMLFKKQDSQWDGEILTLANRLHEAGLHDQALRQYEHYLELPDLEFQHRADVAYKAANLYLQLNNCRDGVVLLHQAQIAWPKAPWNGDLIQKIDACMTKIQRPPRP